jgi:hypothetical protein
MIELSVAVYPELVEGRVGQGITTSPSHRTVRDSLPSYGSYQSFKFRKMFVPSTSV